MSDRRQGRIRVVFQGKNAKVGVLQVGSETWGAVEWSEKRGVWCIEDAEGQCLTHTSSIVRQIERIEKLNYNVTLAELEDCLYAIYAGGYGDYRAAKVLA